MATATATPAAVKARGHVTSELVSLHGEVFAKDGFLQTYNIEREIECDLLGIAVASGIDPLFIGAPGVGKTWMIEMLLMILDGAQSSDFFNTMIFKETPADDILGPRSVSAMKRDEIERMMDGFLPKALIGYLDEIFKASPTLWNALLDIMANRKLKVGNTVHSVAQLISIIASSNELPEREDALPLRDRFAMTKLVRPVESRDGRLRVMQIMDEYQADARQLDLTDAPRLSLADVQAMRREVQRVIIPEAVTESLATAQERWAGKNIEPSQRRIGQMLLGLKARAWTQGRGEAVSDDLLVLEHMAWNSPSHMGDAREVIVQFANEFSRKGLEMKEALEPILTEVSNLRNTIPSDGKLSDDQLNIGSTAAQDLRAMKRDVKEQIERGRRQGHAVTELEDVLDKVTTTQDWLKKTLVGGDDD
jgi:MoxR-like ATPase